jgi:hypothetical protein
MAGGTEMSKFAWTQPLSDGPFPPFDHSKCTSDQASKCSQRVSPSYIATTFKQPLWANNVQTTRSYKYYWDTRPIDCIVTESPWSACSVSCGTGVQTKTRTVTQAAANGGAACPALTAQQVCTNAPCPGTYGIQSVGTLPLSHLRPDRSAHVGTLCRFSKPP